jgi:hypothetical protein
LSVHDELFSFVLILAVCLLQVGAQALRCGVLDHHGAVRKHVVPVGVVTVIARVDEEANRL